VQKMSSEGREEREEREEEGKEKNVTRAACTVEGDLEKTSFRISHTFLLFSQRYSARRSGQYWPTCVVTYRQTGVYQIVLLCMIN
jgi:hypothetical protein